MSTEHGHDELRQEQDRVESKSIVTIGVVALSIFGLGILWAVQIQKDSTAQYEGVGTIRSFTPDQVPVGKRDEIGIVYQTSFDSAFAAKLKAEQTDYLNGVGWVDKDQKKVHIPIKRAMQEYLAESEKAGGKL